MNSFENKVFCVIGLGSHAKNKLIPSIQNINNHKVYSVTRKTTNKIKGIKNFLNIESAFKNLKNEVIYVISTPPNSHYKIIHFLISKKTNIFIEKPIVTKLNHIKKIVNNSSKNNKFLYEIFPYKLSRLYKCFIKDWTLNKNIIKQVNINFLVPSIPKNSFRKSKLISNSILFDMGCYPIGLLVDLGFLIKNPKLKIFYPKKLIKEYMTIKFSENNINISIKIGINKEYQNNINFITLKNEKHLYDYFFYALPKKKSIKVLQDDKINHTKIINDINLFTKLFCKKLNFLNYYKKKRHNNMICTTQILENLSLKAKKIR